MKIKLLLILMVLPMLLFAQERQLVKGRVVSGNFGIKDVLIVNVSAQAETRSDSLGNFKIMAKTGDLFALSDYKIKSKKIRYTHDLVKDNVVMLKVDIEAMELEEIVINKNNNITAEGLGLVPKGQKTYTPGERRLKAASSLDPTFMMGSMGGVSVSADAIINAITGRTKMLKRALEAETKEFLIEKIGTIATAEEITEELKIPPAYVKGFVYFIVEDKEFAAALNKKNESFSRFLMNGLAIEYLERIKNEQ